ncbi:MAG TPA: CDP-alcohol phosphatidyltransferase family protein, partial [Pedococcus sp.]|nr:CDP-alcohol phosphatidyltransferase family protein [Pedococcus sp.]
MSLTATPFVGSASARAVHGYCAGATAVLVPGPADGPGDRAHGGSSGAVGPSGAAGTVDVAEALAELGLLPRDLPAAAPAATLASLAEQAEALVAAPSRQPLAVVAADLRVSPVALLDLFDRPRARTSVATLEADVVPGDPGGFTPVRVERDQGLVHSAGSARHVVTEPTGLAAGALLVAHGDLASAARAWRDAATCSVAADPAVDAFDLALVALVRGGVDVAAAPMGPFDVVRGPSAAVGAAGSPWQQRLRGASRGGDGFFSTFAVRPLSRRLTGLGLAHGWTPNVVTVTSLLMGVLAAALAAVDTRPTWALAAVLLLLALVVDCVDGEIARFTRRFSALGAWLDAVGDRVKEYALLAAVAWVSVRRGEPLWLLACVALALVTVRHLEDYAYADRGRASRAGVHPDRLGLDVERDLGPAGARVTLPSPPTRRQRAVHWAKKVVHMPIAERYLLLALGLLTFSTHVVLWALTVAVAVALAWTAGGRTVKAVLGTDGFRRDERLPAGASGHLDHQLDLGPVARACGRLLALPFPAAVAGVALVVVAAVLGAAAGAMGWLPVVLVLAGVVLVGAGCRPPLQHPLGWQASALLWGA